MPTSWDPRQYLKFEAERARPFHDLVAQVDARPASVVDLGCGPGHLTATLADRWPAARVTGVDSSPDMIAEARGAHPRVEAVQATIEEWRPPAPVDLIVSNAALQWVPSHVDLVPIWVRDCLAPGGTLAFQVPYHGAGAATASEAIRRVADSPRWAGRFTSLAIHQSPTGGESPVRSAAEYLDLLGRLGCRVNTWETTYLHVLAGADGSGHPVLQWFAGTGLRPYLDALADDPDAVATFRAEVDAEFAKAYPIAPYGTVLPFRRIFVVAALP